MLGVCASAGDSLIGRFFWHCIIDSQLGPKSLGWLAEAVFMSVTAVLNSTEATDDEGKLLLLAACPFCFIHTDITLACEQNLTHYLNFTKKVLLEQGYVCLF